MAAESDPEGTGGFPHSDLTGNITGCWPETSRKAIRKTAERQTPRPLLTTILGSREMPSTLQGPTLCTGPPQGSQLKFTELPGGVIYSPQSTGEELLSKGDRLAQGCPASQWKRKEGA